MGGAPTSARGPATTSKDERYEQMNGRGALTLSLVSSEAMMCSQIYDIMHVEEVERLTKVGVLFQFRTLISSIIGAHDTIIKRRGLSKK